MQLYAIPPIDIWVCITRIRLLAHKLPCWLCSVLWCCLMYLNVSCALWHLQWRALTINNVVSAYVAIAPLNIRCSSLSCWNWSPVKPWNVYSANVIQLCDVYLMWWLWLHASWWFTWTKCLYSKWNLSSSVFALRCLPSQLVYSNLSNQGGICILVQLVEIFKPSTESVQLNFLLNICT